MEGINMTQSPPHTVTTEDATVGMNWSMTEEMLTSDGGNEGNVAQSFVDAQCRKTSAVPFSNPCFGTAMQFQRVSIVFISIVGVALNIVSFLALNKMKLNKESLFMMKILSIYDSLYLFASMLMTSPVYIHWAAGLGYIEYTAYYFVYHIMLCVYRISMSVAFWLVCLLTAHR